MKSTIKTLSIFLLCFMAGFSTLAQTPTPLWQKGLWESNKIKRLYEAVESDSKKFWVGTGTNSKDDKVIQGIVYTGLPVIGFTPEGDTLWQQTYHHIFSSPSHFSICKGQNNTFWLATIYTPYPDTSNADIRSYSCVGIVHIDSIGQALEWFAFTDCSKKYIGNFEVLPDGDLLIAGVVLRPIQNACVSDQSIFVQRITPEGNQVYLKEHMMPGTQLPASGGGLYPGDKIVIPYRETATSGPSYYVNKLAFIDTNTGEIVQSKTFANPTGMLTPDRLQVKIYPMPDGSFIVAGWQEPYITEIYGYIARTDANLNVIWQKWRRGVRYYNDVKPLSNGDIVVLYEDTTGFNSGRPVMAKLKKQNGAKEWEYRWAETWPAASYYPQTIVPNKNNVYAIGAGGSQATGSGYYVGYFANVADFLQPSDYCTDSVRANFTGTWQQDTLRLRSTSNSGMAYQDSLNYQWLIEGSTVSIDSAVQQVKNAALYPNGLLVSLVITNFWGCKDTLTAKVMPDGTVVGNRPDIRGGAYLKNAYPNPSAQNVSIGYTLPAKTENAILRVYELGTGRTVAERNLSALDSEVKFNVSGWATGVYAYQLYVNGAPVAVKKMTVSR
jgi:hypothetical protein